jgi:hypothetical protein
VAAVLGDAKITVSLNVAEAKRQIEEMRRLVREQRTRRAPVERAVEKIRREGRDVSGGKGEEKSVAQSLMAAAARRAERFARQGASGVSPAVAAAGSAGGMLGKAGAGAARAVGAAALVYGAIRFGTEAQVFVDQAIEGALAESGILEKIPFLKEMMEFRRGVAQRLDTVEASVKAAITAAGSTGEYATASARIAGAAPGVAAIASQYGDDFAVERKKAELDAAFRRFRRDDLGKAIGATIGEQVKASLQR